MAFFILCLNLIFSIYLCFIQKLFVSLQHQKQTNMRKLVYLSAFIIAAVIVSCSKSDDDSKQQQPTNDYPCKFSIVYEKAGHPEISYVDVGMYGKPERVIDFEIVGYQSMILNPPSPQNTSVYYNQEIRESDFRKYQSHFTEINDKVFNGIMQNDDWFQFDKNDTKTTQSVKVSFHCIHIN